MQRKRTRSARKLIYQLKKVCGFSITLCRSVNSSYNFQTGVEANITSFKIIRKVILLPSELKTEDDRIREDERELVIDYQDIKVFGVEINDVILFDTKAWKVFKIKNHELPFCTFHTETGKSRFEGKPRVNFDCVCFFCKRKEITK